MVAPVYTHLRALAQASLVVLIGFVASRILGLVRNAVLLSYYGNIGDPSGQGHLDAFLSAIAIPDLVFQVLAGGAVGSAFIPVFKSYLSRGEDDQAWRMVNTVLAVAAVAIGMTALALMFFSRPLMELVVPGRDAAFKDMAAEMTRIMLISPVIFALSGFVTSVLQSYNRFGWAALAPVSYNLGIIIGAVVLAPSLGIFGAAYGVVFGAVLHLLVQLPIARHHGLRWAAGMDVNHPAVREVARLFAPRMLGLAVVQLNQLVNVVLASFLMVGSLTALNVSWMVLMAPLALAMAVGTALFPTLAEAGADNRRDEVRELFSLALRLILFLTVPISLGLIVLAAPIVQVLFERGAFTAESTKMTAVALSFYAIGLAGHATVEIADRVFYALHDTATPVRVALGTVSANIVLSLVLMQTGLSYGGLALANSLAALAEAAILAWLLSSRLSPREARSGIGRLSRSLAGFLAAALPMGAVTYLALHLLAAALDTSSPAWQLVLVGSVGLLGALVYLALSAALRSEELFTLWRLVRPGRHAA
jgi:putative peptidoglycan lipid II flippase